MSTRVTRPPVGSLMIVQRLTWFAGFDLACALAHDLIQRRPTGTRTARGDLARRSRWVRSLGDALLPVRGGLLVLAVPGSYLKCRGIRQRRRTWHQVVGVGRVCQDLLVFVAATPLPCPRPSFTGDDGGLLVSMPGPKTPRASMTYLGLSVRLLPAAPTCQNSFFRSYDLGGETGSPDESVDIGDSSNTETDA